MQGADAVDGHAAGNAQVGHTDRAVPDDSHAADLFHIAVIVFLDLLLIAVRDLRQDLPDPGQQRLKQLLGPDLQRLCQHRMVGVRHGVGGDIPRFVPAKARVVDEDPHQLRNHQRRVGIVDLDHILFVEVLQRAVLLDVLPGNGLHRGGHEEVLLLQPQGLALVVVVLRIQHLGDHVRHGPLLTGTEILALREQLHIDGLGGLGVPQPQRVDVVSVVAGDLHVAGHRQHSGVVLMHHHQVSVVPAGTDSTAKVDLLRLLWFGQQPRVTKRFPVVGQLHLLALHDLLLEQAKLVADGIAGGGDLQRRHTVQIAGGQTAQTAVAEAGVRLHIKNIRSLEAQLLDSLLQLGQHVQIIGILHQAAAHQKFQ